MLVTFATLTLTKSKQRHGYQGGRTQVINYQLKTTCERLDDDTVDDDEEDDDDDEEDDDTEEDNSEEVDEDTNPQLVTGTWVVVVVVCGGKGNDIIEDINAANSNVDSS